MFPLKGSRARNRIDTRPVGSKAEAVSYENFGTPRKARTKSSIDLPSLQYHHGPPLNIRAAYLFPTQPLLSVTSNSLAVSSASISFNDHTDRRK